MRPTAPARRRPTSPAPTMVDRGYPGSKTQPGTWRRILALMPRHDVYVEPYLGSGVILGRKAPARVELGYDLDPAVVAAWRHRRWWREGPTVAAGDAMQILSAAAARMDPTWLVYLDPPYLGSVRSARRLYARDMRGADDHAELLDVALALPARVMLSGYWSRLYAGRLAGWRCERFTSMTRGGPRVECVWCNFPAGLELHDVRYVGSGFRERERIKRKRERWVARLRAMDAAERQVIREALELATVAGP